MLKVEQLFPVSKFYAINSTFVSIKFEFFSMIIVFSNIWLKRNSNFKDIYKRKIFCFQFSYQLLVKQNKYFYSYFINFQVNFH